ncbi:MAG: hypothetical protein Alis3KO_05460 [Aliiglaciecola sp.]
MDFIVFVALIALAIVLKFAKRGGKPVEESEIQHFAKEFLTTQSERKLYFALREVLGNNYAIHCQTSLIALVEPTQFKHKSKAWSKRMDYVITDTNTKILAVIELDDPSHNQPKRVARDKYVNSALKGLHPLVRLKTQSYYDQVDVAKELYLQAGIKSKKLPLEIPQPLTGE